MFFGWHKISCGCIWHFFQYWNHTIEVLLCPKSLMQTGIIDCPWYLPLDPLPKASCMSLGCPWSLHFAIWQLILLAISSPMRTAMHCQGPASAESRDTLRTNGVSKRWHGETKLRWSRVCSFIFKKSFYTLSYTFPKVKDAESCTYWRETL